MSYRDRLITLDLLPLTYDREVEDLVSFISASLIIFTLMYVVSQTLFLTAVLD